MKMNILYPLLFIAIIPLCRAELKQADPAFGVGKHANYDYKRPDEIQVVGQLDKNGRIFECVRIDAGQLVIREKAAESDGSDQDIFTFSPKWGVSTKAQSLELRLVDVWIGNDELSFLFADSGGYGFVHVQKKPLTLANGLFYYAGAGLNSNSWAVTLMLRCYDLGYNIPGWSHHEQIEGLRLTAKKTFTIDYKFETVTGTDSFEVEVGVVKKNGVVLADGSDPFNCSIVSEAKIIAEFGNLADGEVKEAVELMEGGKARILAILEQFADANAATIIRTRINEAYE